MPIGDLLAQINGEKPPAPTNGARRMQPPKRQADTELPRSNGKHVKTEATPANSSRPMAQGKTHINGDSSTNGRSMGAQGDRGVVLQPKVAAPPKKGSHAEIMARAKAAQEMVKGKPGEIKHKPIERGASNMGARGGRSAGGASWGSKSNRSGLGGDGKEKDVKSRRPNEKDEKSGGAYTGTAKPKPLAYRGGKAAAPPVEPVKKIKKAATATTGYTGTARPTKVNPRANINSAAAPRRDSTPSLRLPLKQQSRYERPVRQWSYADEDEEEEEEEDYESDVSSDMEARPEDLEEEEEMALRIAKREDQEEEKRLKREAEEKRRRLAARGGR